MNATIPLALVLLLIDLGLQIDMNRKRVLFLHPSIRARFNGKPIGTLYVATTALSAGHDIQFIDLQASPMETNSLVTKVQNFNPHVIAISSTSPSHKEACELARLIRESGCTAIIIKGGVHETYCAPTTLSRHQYIDYCMVGESDIAFVNFLDAIDNPSSLSKVPQLAYREGTAVKINPPGPKIHLDELPIIERSLLENRSAYDFLIFNGRKTTQVQTMRGCPFLCSFCNQRNRNPLVRSTESVINELSILAEQGFEAVFFDDATFTVNRRRTNALLDAIIDADLGMQFGCQTRASLLGESLAQKMGDAGFAFISFGLETADPVALKSVLKSPNPGQHVSDSLNAIKFCAQAGIRSCLNLISGFENETIQSLRLSLEFAANVSPDFVSLSALARYPHEDLGTTELYERGVSREPIWEEYDEGYGSYHPFMTPEYASLALDEARKILATKLDVT